MSPRAMFSREGKIIPLARAERIEATQEDVLFQHSFKESDESNERSKDAILQSLSRLDMGDLQNILEQVGGRCGIDPDKLNFTESEMRLVSFRDHGDKSAKGVLTGGEYDSVSNKIYLSIEGLMTEAWILSGSRKKMSEKGEVAEINELELFVAILRAVIHEKIHAISFVQMQESKNRLPGMGIFKEKIFRIITRGAVLYFDKKRAGYAVHEHKQHEDGRSEVKGKLVEFDEGVTEKLAVQLSTEYLLKFQSDRYSKKAIERAVKSLCRPPLSEYIAAVDELIKDVAKDTGFSEEVVWNAIVRSKIEGVNLEDPELKSLFDKADRVSDSGKYGEYRQES